MNIEEVIQFLNGLLRRYSHYFPDDSRISFEQMRTVLPCQKDDAQEKLPPCDGAVWTFPASHLRLDLGTLHRCPCEEARIKLKYLFSLGLLTPKGIARFHLPSSQRPRLKPKIAWETCSAESPPGVSAISMLLETNGLGTNRSSEFIMPQALHPHLTATQNRSLSFLQKLAEIQTCLSNRTLVYFPWKKIAASYLVRSTKDVPERWNDKEAKPDLPTSSAESFDLEKSLKNKKLVVLSMGKLPTSSSAEESAFEAFINLLSNYDVGLISYASFPLTSEANDILSSVVDYRQTAEQKTFIDEHGRRRFVSVRERAKRERGMLEFLRQGVREKLLYALSLGQSHIEQYSAHSGK